MPSSGGQTCALDRKSTRLNSSHGSISHAVFCLKKKRKPVNSRAVSDAGIRSLSGERPRAKSSRTLLHAGASRGNRRVILEIVEEIFFFNDTATTEIYTLSLHDALPI